MKVTRDSEGAPDGIIVPASLGRAVVPFLRGEGYRVRQWADVDTGPVYIVRKSGAKVYLTVIPQEGDTDQILMVLPEGLMGLLKRDANRQLRSEIIETVGNHIASARS